MTSNETLGWLAFAPAINEDRKSIIIQRQPIWVQATAAWTLFAAERIVAATLCCRWADVAGISDSPGRQPVIFCIWHNRLAFTITLVTKE